MGAEQSINKLPNIKIEDNKRSQTKYRDASVFFDLSDGSKTDDVKVILPGDIKVLRPVSTDEERKRYVLTTRIGYICQAKGWLGTYSYGDTVTVRYTSDNKYALRNFTDLSWDVSRDAHRAMVNCICKKTINSTWSGYQKPASYGYNFGISWEKMRKLGPDK